MFDFLNKIVPANNVIVIDFTHFPDDGHFDELQDLLSPKIIGGKVVNGELIDIKYEKFSLPSKWIREINAVANELDSLATANLQMRELTIKDKDRGNVPNYYADNIKRNLRITSPIYVTRIDEIYSCIGKITKVTVKSIITIYKAYFAAMDKDLIDSLAKLTDAYKKYKISTNGGEYPYTPADAIENLMAETITWDVSRQVSRWNTMDMYLDTFKREGMESLNEFEAREYEELASFLQISDPYYDYQDYMKYYNLFCYCVIKNWGERSGEKQFGREYFESLFDEFGIPHKLDTIPNF